MAIEGEAVMRNRAVFLLAIFVSLPALCAAQKISSSEGQRFVGVWQSVSITDMRPDGTEVPDLYLGPDPTGMLIYDASGFMCAGNMNPDRKKWTDPSRGAREELALLPDNDTARPSRHVLIRLSPS